MLCLVRGGDRMWMYMYMCCVLCKGREQSVYVLCLVRRGRGAHVYGYVLCLV